MRRFFLCSSFAVLSASMLLSQPGRSAPNEHESPISYLDQGWSNQERSAWYTATQGSRLMPASWFRSLEIAEGTELFNSKTNMRRFRFIFDDRNPTNPYPIGFAEDRQSDKVFEETQLRWIERGFFKKQSKYEEWIGLNCSACHTAEVHFEGQKIRIDGGPAIIDFQTFDEEIASALRATLDDDQKFARFAARVASEDPGTQNDLLKDALHQLTKWRERVVSVNDTDLRYGFSRLDAFGHIYNQVALFSDVDGQFFQGSDAPVSFPFLWDTPQHDKVQWNGIAENGPKVVGIDIGALGRNAGEVIGVFGEVNVNKRTGSDFLIKPRTASSVSINNLIELERSVERLISPQWPANVLGELDQEGVSRGQELFIDKCQSCHNPIDRDDPNRKVQAQMSMFMTVDSLTVDEKKNAHGAPGTDPAMACRATERLALRSVRFAGVKVDTDDRTEKRELKETDRLSALLATMVTSSVSDQAGELIDFVLGGSKGLIVNNPGATNETPQSYEGDSATLSKKESREALKSALSGTAYASGDAPQAAETKAGDFGEWGPFTDCMTSNPSRLKSYKARPLNGIWATAPFLHNGSVANLYELLLPPSERMAVFYTGSYDFDTERVGYVTAKSERNSFSFDVLNPDGSFRWGNFNGGHDYDNEALTDDQRWDLVEYMKSL